MSQRNPAHAFARAMLHYDIQLSLEPGEGTMKADACLSFRSPGGDSPFAFLLHSGLDLQSVEGSGVERFEYDQGPSPYPFAPSARVIRVWMSRQPARGETVHFRVAYQGRPGVVQPWQVNRMTPQWVEMGLYMPWFPFDPEKVPFTFELNLTTEPLFQVISGDSVQKDGHGYHVISHEPVNDITILAAPMLLVNEAGSFGRPIRVYCVSPEDALTASAVSEDATWAMSFYHRTFGGSEQPVMGPIVIAPRKEGGAYFRKGLIVMPSTRDYCEDRPGGFRWIAHEVAHRWWQSAPAHTWEDWLNESFAEYSALMAVRSRFGTRRYEQLLMEKRHRSCDLPPIMGIDRSDEKCRAVLYHKGCVLLADLEGLIGFPSFHSLLRAAAAVKAPSTDAFMGILSREVSQDAAHWLHERLHA